MKDLQKLFIECISEMDAIGIEYGNIVNVYVNTRAKSRLGQTRAYYNGDREDWDTNTYEINISNEILNDDYPTVFTKDTIIHEILHTCKDCMKHTGEWKRLANLVNDCYPCYHISRCSTDEENRALEKLRPKKEKEFKYELQCTKCGHIYYYSRMSKYVKNPNSARCGCENCNGKIIRIK